jgi:hypothetical protein
MRGFGGGVVAVGLVVLAGARARPGVGHGDAPPYHMRMSV